MTRLLAVAALLVLAGCNVPTDQQSAYAACGGTGRLPAYQAIGEIQWCMASYAQRVQANRDAEWALVGAMLAGGGGFVRRPAAPVFVGCTTVGLVTNCVGE